MGKCSNLMDSEYFKILNILEDVNDSGTDEKKVSNVESGLAYFFPYLYNSISGRIQFIFPLLTSKDPKETKLINSKVSNLNVDVYINNSPIPNAYTLPSISSVTGSQIFIFAGSMPLIRNFALIPYILYSFNKLENFESEGVSSDGKVLFSNPNDVKILCWETKGLRGMLNEKERLAVILHEIGHWVKYKNPILSLFFKYGLFGEILVVPIIIGIVLGRTGEYEADEFVKRCGYSEELISALRKTSFSIRRNISILGKISDIVRTITNRIMNVVDYVLPLSSHPAPTKRIRQLGESELVESLIQESMTRDALKAVIRKVLVPLDKVLADNVEHVFPLSK